MLAWIGPWSALLAGRGLVCAERVFQQQPNNLFFLFFFFAILTSSFQRGFEEGARVPLDSAELFAGTAMLGETDAELSRLLLRATFLLAPDVRLASNTTP